MFGLASTNSMKPIKIEVKHDQFPTNDVVINPVWCDIGSHMVSEEEMAYTGPMIDASVCQGCYDHYNDRWD